MVKTTPPAPKTAPKPAASTSTLAAASPTVSGGADTIVGGGSDADVDAAIDGGIQAAMAGRRPLPTPASEAAKAIAEAPIDPRPGSGTLNGDRAVPEFDGLSDREVESLNVLLSISPAHQLAEFRHFLANAPIEPGVGQGTLDDRRRRLIDYAASARAPFLAPAGVVEPVETGLALDEIKGPALRVVALKEGFRRAGRAWSTAGTFVAEEDFTDEELQALLTDPNLIVRKA